MCLVVAYAIRIRRLVPLASRNWHAAPAHARALIPRALLARAGAIALRVVLAALVKRCA
jgi:hypothetical protein